MARMTGDVRALTGLILTVTVMLWVMAVAGPPSTKVGLGTGAAVSALVNAVTWLALRPQHFVIDETTLKIVWCVHSRRIPRQTIKSSELLDHSEFRSRYGTAVRFGIGGLWGTFGTLRTSSETFSIFTSRTDQYVLLRFSGGARSLLISPEDAPTFVAVLTSMPTPADETR